MKSTLKKHKLVSILSILAILFTLMPVSAFAAETMDDISDHWAKEQIQSWVDNEYIKGYPDGTFKPDNNITRAEFITIANNAFGYTEKAEISYSDVSDGSWYAEAVAIASAAGYITGYPDGTMKPDAPITRQEAAVIITKINELESDEAAADIFTDSSAIASWSKGSIGACVTAEIFTGYPDDSFRAENLIKRGESVVALGRALDYYYGVDELAVIVYGIHAEGFRLAFYPAVDGLTESAVTLTRSGSTTGEAISVEGITTEDGGEIYTVTAELEVGQTYDLALTIEDYEFGAPITFTVLTDQEAADQVNQAIAALPATDELTLENIDVVAGAKMAFDALTDEQASLITDENKTKLEAAVDKITQLLTENAISG
jgi:hypothetical protein